MCSVNYHFKVDNTQTITLFLFRNQKVPMSEKKIVYNQNVLHVELFGSQKEIFLDVFFFQSVLNV